MTNPTTFTDLEAARSYEQVGMLPRRLQGRLAEFVASHFDARQPKILDVACGRGDFSLAILRLLARKGLQFSYEGFDLSEPMLAAFKARLGRHDKKLQASVRLWNGDVNQELARLRSEGREYGLIIATFFLHYFAEWRCVLEQIHDLLAPEAILVQSTASGYYACLGKLEMMEAQVPLSHIAFWREFFRRKHDLLQMEPWQNFYDFRTMSEIKDFLQDDLRLQAESRLDLCWNRWLSFGDLLGWIMASPLSSIGGGLSSLDRLRLVREMVVWLQCESLSLDQPLLVPFSWEVFIHRKVE